MNKRAVILILSGCFLAFGCSRPTAEAPVAATPTPKERSERERNDEAKTVERQELKANSTANEPMDAPILAVSPSPSASTPKP
jgi:hypothetical protein